MKQGIDPLVDCCLQSLFGSEKSTSLLISFLNAVMGKQEKLINKVTFEELKEEKAKGQSMPLVQLIAEDQKKEEIMIQLRFARKAVHPNEIMGTFALLYSSQPEPDFRTVLKDAVVISLLMESSHPESNAVHLNFGIGNNEMGMLPSVEGCRMHCLQLDQWKPDQPIKTDLDRWITFLKTGEELDPQNLPEELDQDIFREALQVLLPFKEEEEKHRLYLSHKRT